MMPDLKALKKLQTEDKLKALEGAYADEGWLFANELGVPYYPGMMSTWFNQAVKACSAALEDDAKLRRISFHGCRHTTATLMLKDGTAGARRLPVPWSFQLWTYRSNTYAHVLPGQDESAVVSLVAMYS